MYPSKDEMLVAGDFLTTAFCTANMIAKPRVDVTASGKDWNVNACAYYRRDTIKICPPKCASVGVAGMAWSFPGYVVDRTPYGVLQHELGHHVDVLSSCRAGPYYGDYSVKLRQATGEKPITTYAPNDAEWFAEIFRLFVTNPDLLRLIRPRTYDALASVLKPVINAAWDVALIGAPQRTIDAAERRIKKGT